MKAYWYETAGNAFEVLQFGDIQLPELKEGEVRVKMSYSAINLHDTKKRRDGTVLKQFGKIIPNCDGSGHIEAVGPDVSSTRIGEAVWIFGAQVRQAHGTAAEYCTVPAIHATPIPKDISLVFAANLGIPAFTAYQALKSLKSGIASKQVYVTGGSGRVGFFAIQFAKLLGATVITSTRDNSKFADLKALGADYVFNSNDEQLRKQIKEATKGEGVNLILESAFARNIELDAKIIAQEGTICSYGFDDQTPHSIPHTGLLLKNANLRYLAIFTLPADEQRRTFQELNELIKADEFTFPKIEPHPFNLMPQLHEKVGNGEYSGPAIVDVNSYEKGS